MSTIADVLYEAPPVATDLPSEGRFEFVNGQVLARPDMGANSDWIATNLIILLGVHAKAHPIGRVFGASCGYQCFDHEPRRVRYPDVSIIRSGRLPDDVIPKGHVRIAPDLAVEVISPNDEAYDVEERITDFLKAGAPLLWVFYPSTRHVMVFRQGPDCTRLGESGTLDGEGVLPGFTCKIADLFPEP